MTMDKLVSTIKCVHFGSYYNFHLVSILLDENLYYLCYFCQR